MDVLITGPELNNKFSGGIQTHIRNFQAAFENNSEISVRFFPITLGLYKNETWLSKFARNAKLVMPFISKVSQSDLVHLNSTFDTRSVLRDVFYASLARFMLNKKVVIQFHGGRPGELVMYNLPVVKSVLAFVYKRCTGVLILSRLQGDEFRRCFPDVGYDIVHNFLDVQMEISADRTYCHDSDPTFLFISRLHEKKGVKEILAAANDLKKEGYTFNVVFCGDGPLRSWLIEHIDSLSLSDNVKYLGVVHGEKKEEVFISANVLLLPTWHKEGFPYTILEAFKYSMPVISCPEGAIPEVLVDGKNGYLIEAKNARVLKERMKVFCDHPERMGEMGRAARSLAEQQYSLNNMLQSFEKIYRQ